jgi:uncharacterized membrane protein
VSSTNVAAKLDVLTSARARMVAALLVGLVSALIVNGYDDWRITVVGAWDAASLYLLGVSWYVLASEDAGETRERAAAEDPGRAALRVILVVCSTASLFAAALVAHGQQSKGQNHQLLAVLTLVAAASSWSLMHSSYALHYAHLHHSDEAPHGKGLSFPGDDEPCGIDFAYFSFTVGMCFQTSDVSIETSRLRSAVLGHSVLSFVYNTLVIALTINLMVGELQ